MERALVITSGDPELQSEKRYAKKPICKLKQKELDVRYKWTNDTLPFDNEMIRPCLCETNWHRACIREHIVRNEIVACSTCKFEFCVGYTDCLAIFNKKRPNYLAYMLVQEFVLTVAE